MTDRISDGGMMKENLERSSEWTSRGPHAWIAVDLDGTLAHYDGWNGGQIGDPIPLMLARVKQWLADGIEVRIFTARVGVPDHIPDNGGSAVAFAENQRRLIEEWCEKHVGQRLRVTATKDFCMIALWDDRAVSVITNTGQAITPSDIELTTPKLCLICEKVKPWAGYDRVAGVALCEECRDKAQKTQRRIDLVESHDGDWAGLYVDYQLFHQGHQIPEHVLIEAMGTPVHKYEADGEWLEEETEFPKHFRDIPSDKLRSEK